jgi:chaperone LolA
MKKVLSIFLVLILFVSFSISAFSSAFFDITAKEIIEKVQERYKKSTTVVAKYSQTVKFKLSKIEQVFNGTLYLKKEKKYRIETDQQTIITDGVTSWAYSSKTKQVVIDNFKEDKNSISPEKFLTQYPEDYYSNLIGKSKVNNQETYELKLTPKSNSSFIKSMKVWVDSDEWFIRKIEWVDMNDNTNTYVVKKIDVNTELGNDKFQFKQGKDIQAIDLR